MNRDEALLAFSSLKDIQMDVIRKLIALFGEPEAFFELTESQLISIIEDNNIKPFIAGQLCQLKHNPPIAKLQRELKDKKIGFIRSDDEKFPGNLRNIKEPPLYLFYQGQLPADENKIAVIGARNCSVYGKEIAVCFSKLLAGCGINIVSGMARGIDGYAHEGALCSGGKTIAVLGFGIDECYPRENYGLMRRISEQGCLISEYAPGTKAKPLNFPARNRLIAGLADGLLVVEAAKKSGTLITVDFALEQGKNIYAIPGRVGDPLSAGCNELIKNGCYSVTEPEEILRDFGYVLCSKKSSSVINGLDENTMKIYSCADASVKYTNDFVRESGLDIQNVIQILYELEEKGLILQPFQGAFIKIPQFS